MAARLLADGAFAENCLPPMPTLTSTNWTGLATGAWPGTHGVTDFNMHKPGQALTDCPQAFTSDDCEAEFIWNAAARAGKRSILVNYPVTIPPVLDNGVQIGGAGCEVTDWRIGIPAEDRSVILGAEQLFTTGDEPLATPVVWGEEASELRLPFSFPDARFRVDSQIELTVTLIPGENHCSLECPEGVTVAKLAPGEWTGTIAQQVVVDGLQTMAVFRVKLLALDEQQREFRLFVTDVCALSGLEFPAGALGDISDLDGLPLGSVGSDAYMWGWIDLDTHIELLKMSVTWIEQASIRLMSTNDWDIYYTHFHTIDWFYHTDSAKLDPQLTPDPADRAVFESAEIELYQAVDAAIGAMIDAVEEPPLVVVVSDHGATGYVGELPTADLLVDAGLLTFKSDASREHDYGGGYLTSTDIDWEHTLAIPQRSSYVYVNLKGRDPHGTVEPEDYVKVQEQIVRTLQTYRDPLTGICPYSLVLRKDDARILGLYGDRVGDVVYTIREDVGDEHGRQLGTAESSGDFGSLRSILCVSGPGTKSGEVVSRTVWLTDVVPTICQIARLPVPSDVEGAVVYQMLENPNALLDDYERVRSQYDKVTASIRRRQALTHDYKRAEG